MLARKTSARAVLAGGTKPKAIAKGRSAGRQLAEIEAAAKRAIRKQAAEITSLSETQNQLFAAMLAEMDSRIDEITARTDRLLAQHV